MMDLDKLTQRPDMYLNAGFFGLEKRGKTTNAFWSVLRAHAMLELRGHVAIVDTENMVADWFDRVAAATGKPPVICPPNSDGDHRDPAHVRRFLRACEDDDRVVAVIIDSLTDLQKGPRAKFAAEKGRQPKLNEWTTIDKPYNDLVEYLKRARIHRAMTFRETDDRVEVDGEEKVVGKKAKGGDGGYVPRILVHCTTARTKGKTVHVVTVDDCKSEASARLVNPTAADWDTYIGRLQP